MKFSLQQKKSGKKTESSRCVFVASIFAVLSNRRLVKNRRAVSSVVSNLILIAAVIAVGFTALSYANSVSNNHVIQYGQAINEDIDQLREVVSFEYASYSSSTRSLSVYFMNAGSISNLWINNMTVSNSTWSWTWNWTSNDRPMCYLNNSVAAKLSIGQEAYITVVLPQPSDDWLVAGNLYTIKLITGRGSIFAYNFMV